MDLTNYWNKVKKTGSCWFWIGANSNGYGYWEYDKKTHSVHRLSYEEHIGKIGEGQEIDHLCTNRNCVNPEHLEAVSHLVNANRSRLVKHGKTPAASKPVADKKFLLYIHNPKFREEKHKSALVNKLLEEHYRERTPPRPLVQNDITNLAEELNKRLKEDKENSVKYCKNNHPLDDRGRCFGKGCKYS